MPAFDLPNFLTHLPHLPGVYRMLSNDSTVLYVGKAKDLKKRVNSYFQKTEHSPRICLMLAQVASIETTVTRSEGEAFLLEDNLIKALNPRYNILFRDDKSYPYIEVTQHAFPRIGFHRGSLHGKHQYFGPYPNGFAVRETLQLLQKLFRLRPCEDSVFAHRSRPCLLYQIKRCTGPCVGLIDETAYRQDVAHATLFLQGKQREVIQVLSNKMQSAAADQQYEEAALLRDQIQNLNKMQEKQFISSTTQITDADVIAFAHEGGVSAVNLVMVRGGRHLGDRTFFPSNVGGSDAAQVLDAFLSQHYIQQIPPRLIVLNAELDTLPLEAWLSEKAECAVRLLRKPTGERKVWLRMAEQNALIAIGQHLQQQATQSLRLHALQEALNFPITMQRIECFDISHTMGEATIASCVVYDKVSLQAGEYRRYNITGITPGDDFAAMHAALVRRYQKIVMGEGKRPDLILIDGGKGQVSVALEALVEVGLSDIAVIGVAKGEGRKPGLEQLIIPHQANLQLGSDHPGLHLIQQIRDEAHRFAITGHRAKRAKTRTASSLEEISGVGAKRRQKLLLRFGGLKGVMAASVEELAQVAGINRQLAEKIHQTLKTIK